MADFPSKVTTETSPPNPQGGNSFRGMAASVTFKVDISFIRSIPAILMTAEIFFGLLHWALIAATPFSTTPVYGWVLFVAITLWILTTILFLMILFSATQRLDAVPWPLVVMVYHGTATVLYFTAFLANAVSVHYYYFGHLAAAVFFAAVVTVTYGASAFFSLMDWRGNTAATTTTVPT